MKVLPWIAVGAAVAAVVYVIVNAPEPGYASGDVESAANRADLWGAKQRVTGTGGSVVGKLKEGFGNVTGDDDLAAEGVVDQVAGAVKDTAGKAANAVSGTLRDLNRP